MPVRAVRRPAPAKLNLYLHVVGRRLDGYHLLESLVAFADVADAVTASEAGGLELRVEGRFAPALAGAGEDNLVHRAAVSLAARAGIAPRAALLLEKNLPVASGIGGGSSDAAAALHALAELWHLDLGEPRFAGLAESLGADVPVCLLGCTAWLGGIGEQVSTAPPLPECAVLLANPGIAVATPAVFKARTGAFSQPARFEHPFRDVRDLVSALAQRRNDLTSAAISLVPEISEVLRALSAAPGALLARMSGSGATCFALFAGLAEARDAAERLAAERPGWWVAAGRLI